MNPIGIYDHFDFDTIVQANRVHMHSHMIYGNARGKKFYENGTKLWNAQKSGVQYEVQ